MATFYNQATLIFDGSSTSSNITEGEFISGAAVLKTALSSDYIRGDGVSYSVLLTNAGSTAVTGLTVTDDLGAFTPEGMTAPVTPLTYTEGSLLYYVNGITTTAPTATVTADGLVISGINIPAGSNALLVYEAKANEYAPLSSGSVITNTVTLTGATSIEENTSTATVPVRDWTSLTIAKAICPATVGDNGELTYTFIIQNTGNTPAEATDNIIVTDTFTPILNPITVTQNGVALTEGVDYTYNSTTGEFATVAGVISVPAASFTTNTTTGIVSTVPGVTVITVTGIV